MPNWTNLNMLVKLTDMFITYILLWSYNMLCSSEMVNNCLMFSQFLQCCPSPTSWRVLTLDRMCSWSATPKLTLPPSTTGLRRRAIWSSQVSFCTAEDHCRVYLEYNLANLLWSNVFTCILVLVTTVAIFVLFEKFSKFKLVPAL